MFLNCPHTYIYIIFLLIQKNITSIYSMYCIYIGSNEIALVRNTESTTKMMKRKCDKKITFIRLKKPKEESFSLCKPSFILLSSACDSEIALLSSLQAMI